MSRIQFMFNETTKGNKMTKVTGTHNGRMAERWSDGKVFIWVGTRWIQEIGQESQFVPDNS